MEKDISLNRIIPDVITSIDKNEIFVFGSNLSGIHGKGAAKTAIKWGAKYGIGVGLSGNTYAIPTKDFGIKRSLTIEEIKVFVDDFIVFTKNNDNLIFLVTEIGCGLANHKKEDIAPLFKDGIVYKNIHFSKDFWNILLKK